MPCHLMSRSCWRARMGHVLAPVAAFLDRGVLVLPVTDDGEREKKREHAWVTCGSSGCSSVKQSTTSTSVRPSVSCPCSCRIQMCARRGWRGCKEARAPAGVESLIVSCPSADALGCSQFKHTSLHDRRPRPWRFQGPQDLQGSRAPGQGCRIPDFGTASGPKVAIVARVWSCMSDPSGSGTHSRHSRWEMTGEVLAFSTRPALAHAG